MGNKESERWMMKAMIMFVMVELVAVNGEFPRFQHPTKADGSLTVLVVGDWGRKGTYNQSQVANQMGVTTEKMDIDFVISTGDNFYSDGLIDANDPAFDQSFTDIYTAPTLQKTWYTDILTYPPWTRVNMSTVYNCEINGGLVNSAYVLGNHDYRGDALAQLSPILNARDSRWFCMRSYILDTDTADFFFIDTTPFQDKYFTDPEDHVYDWRGVLPRDKYLSTLLKDLELALTTSNAKWKIVVGHHTIKSASDHGNTEELVEKVLPILEANGVDLYINGHDHCLQHISSSESPLQFLTSGGGSKAWRGVYNWANPKEMKFFYDGQGFMTMQITRHQIEINFYDIFGNKLYKWSAAPQSFISAL